MDVLFSPSIYGGLLTLILLEIVLGIDNVVFIAIIADKLPPKQRKRAQTIGLFLALIIRLILLVMITWLVNLTQPFVNFGKFSFSGRDIILLCGGIFLLFKATTELHERLENKEHDNHVNRNYSDFWTVVLQIIILDAIFSMDAIITAVGMMNHLSIMIIAVIIATSIMLFASNTLTVFINNHQTVVVLCLSFLLMIGLSLIAEGFGLHIPKGYLYAAIGFSIIIELFNQIARHNFIKHQSAKTIRYRTADAIMRLIGAKTQCYIKGNEIPKTYKEEHFVEEERNMITGVLSLASRTLHSIMTPRNEITWLDAHLSVEKLRIILMNTPHNIFPVCNGSLDKLIGIVRAKDLISVIESGKQVSTYASDNPAIVVPETLNVLKLLKELRRAKGAIVMVSNEFGSIQGLITPLDVLEAIAGEFPDADETPEIEVYDNGWLAKGSIDLHALQQALNTQTLIPEMTNIASLAGLLLSQCNHMPVIGEILIINEWRFIIQNIIKYRIEWVWIERISTQHSTIQK